MLWHWLLRILGVDDLSGPWYGWWSGAGSDLAYLGILAAIVRHGNCEVKGCWRLGRHRTAAGHRVCRRHHPDEPLTAGQVQAEHRAARIRLHRQETR